MSKKKQFKLQAILQILCLALFINSTFSQQWKEMANDININIYDVVAEAEAHFETIDKTFASTIKIEACFLNANKH